MKSSPKKPTIRTLRRTYLNRWMFLTMAAFVAVGAVFLLRTYAAELTGFGSEVTVEGTFSHRIVDYEDHEGRDVYTVKSTDGEYETIDPATVPPEKVPRTGSKVRIHGKKDRTDKNKRIELSSRDDSLVVLEESRLPDLDSAPALERAPVSYRRLVILLNFTNPGTLGTAQVRTLAEQQRLLSVPFSPDAYWRDTSYGQVNLTSTAVGPFTISGTGAADCTDTSAHLWADRADAAARAAGINLANYTHFAYTVPFRTCGFSGTAEISGTKSWLLGASTTGGYSDFDSNGTSYHEFGHNIGLRHSYTTSCTSGTTRVTLSATCTDDTYGDLFDAMGDSGNLSWPGRLMSSYHRVQLANLPQSKIRTVTASGHYTIASVNTNPSQTTLPQGLRIARKGSTLAQSFDIELRSPLGTFDAFSSTDPAVTGVLTRLVPVALGASLSSKLLDMTPATPTYSDASLKPGMTFTDTASSLVVRVASVANGQAVVSVTLNGVSPGPAPTPPPGPTPTPTPTPPPPPPPVPSGQTPFSGSALAVPGRVEMENFDNGGEGVAYHDLDTINEFGSTYRTGGVDIRDVAGVSNGRVVSAGELGEWLEYTLNVAQAGVYTAVVRAGNTGSGGTLRLELNGTPLSGGTVTIPNTGAYATMADSAAVRVTLPAGTHILRTFVATRSTSASLDLGRLDYLQFTADTVTSPTDVLPPSVAVTTPATGASAVVGTAVPIVATASDNVGVTKVDILVDNVLKATDITAPYGYTWPTAGLAAGAHTITAKAYDAAGNTTTSGAVTFMLSAPPTTALPGDANGDGRVNAIDLSILIAQDGQNYPPADFNGDGTVGSADMAILLSRWTW